MRIKGSSTKNFVILENFANVMSKINPESHAPLSFFAFRKGLWWQGVRFQLSLGFFDSSVGWNDGLGRFSTLDSHK